MRQTALHLVHIERTPADMLAQLVPELIAAEQIVLRLRRQIAEQTQALAKARGVKFIREESVRREFGHGVRLERGGFRVEERP